MDKQLSHICDHIVQDDQFLQDLGSNVWVMDNHKWAFYVWEKSRFDGKLSPPGILVHVDCHWDDIDDFIRDDSKLMETRTLDDLFHLIIPKTGFIRLDSFIAPAVRKGLFDEVHYYCLQSHDGKPGVVHGEGWDSNIKEFIHSDIQDIMINLSAGKQICFDLDLDIFNRDCEEPDIFQEGDLWREEEILQFMDVCRPLVRAADVVTIAASFDFSGGEAATRYLLRLIVPWVLKVRQS